MTMETDKQATLAEALAKAQAEFPAITQDRQVTVKTKTGGHYSYSYAPLESILAKCRPVLNAHGLALLQILDDDGRGPALRTELRHAGGGVVGGTFPLPGSPADPQALGSLLTYLRRYAVTAILGIATEEDDDGEGAKPQPRGQPQADEAEGDDLRQVGAEVQRLFEELRGLETQLGYANRDWTSWIRGKVGVSGQEPATPDHWRRAIPILEAEQAKLVGELAEQTKQRA